jgi:hypothetical protein
MAVMMMWQKRAVVGEFLKKNGQVFMKNYQFL